MKVNWTKFLQYGLLASLILIVVLAEIFVQQLSISKDRAMAIGILARLDQLLLIFAAVLAITLYQLQRQTKQRADELQKEQEKSSRLAARLASHKIGVDAHAIVSITDPRGRIKYVNDKFCEISKYSREELIGQNHRLLNSAYHDKDFFSEMYRCIYEGRAWSGDVRNRAKDGTLYWVSTTVMPILDENEKIEEIISIRRDITDIKRNAEELETSNALLNSTLQNFPGAISSYNKDLVLQTANAAFYAFLDIPEDRFPLGSRFEDMTRFNAERGDYGEGDVEELVAERVALANKFEEHCFTRKMPDGRVLEIKGWPLIGGGFVSAHIDVTERHRMIENLRRKNEEAQKTARDLKAAQQAQEQTYQHLVDSINSTNNGFAIWDRDGFLVLANDAFRRFHSSIAGAIRPGLQIEHMLRLGCEAKIWAVSGGKCEAWIEACLKFHRSTGSSEEELVLTDGTQLVVTSQHLDNGDVITTLIDVTAQRERERELNRTKEALEHIAYFDALTTLPNRAQCQQDLEALFANQDDHDRFSIILIDLDKFKRVNDTLGHASGDELLKALGSRLNFLGTKVPYFKPYRWGGDEFIAIVEGIHENELESLCQELTDLIAIPLTLEGPNPTTLWPTVSLGIASYPGDATDLEALMIYADLALYKTKEMGRDGYQFFSAEMKEKIDEDSRIEVDVRSALKLDQFELYFQPQISTVDESISGVEALLRWNHPERGQLPPGLFMDVVESHGMAAPLGRRVFDLAMAAAKAWSDQGLDFGRLAINLSPGHLKKKTLIDDFCDSLDRHKVNPDLLAVELLESVLVNDEDPEMNALFERIAASGVHIELDDFGTGYASLAHLSALPVDGIKIDRSFVNNISSSEKQQAIVEVVMSMSRLMQLRVVCEGIETHQQLSTVSQISNCSVQGYLVSRPLSFNDMTQWIKDEQNIGLLTPKKVRRSTRSDKKTGFGAGDYY